MINGEMMNNLKQLEQKNEQKEIESDHSKLMKAFKKLQDKLDLAIENKRKRLKSA